MVDELGGRFVARHVAEAHYGVRAGGSERLVAAARSGRARLACIACVLHGQHPSLATSCMPLISNLGTFAGVPGQVERDACRG